MESALNPYSPGSGRRPFELAGREGEIDAFDLLLAKTRQRRPDRGIVLHGLRGVGKTVLLNEFRRQAEHAEFMVVSLEGRDAEGGPEAVRAKLARNLLQAGRKLNRRGAGAKLIAALGSIASFSAKLGVSGIDIGVNLNHGRADSGSIEVDLEELIEDLCGALAENRTGLVFIIDEMQDLDDGLITALLSAQHLANQREWPFYIAGAGLPNLPSVLSEARSYAERIFNYRSIGALTREAAESALVVPASRYGASFAPEAKELLLTASGGYPYFLQEYGYAAWETAPEKLVTLGDAEVAVEIGRAQLDQGFFPSRWKRASTAEKSFLRLMADDGDAGSSTAELALRAQKKQSSMTMTRASLIDKGIIYSPALGTVAFTVPGMADYVKRLRD
ncbi:ATP-binding protein [Pseudarthrobacter raffinosi]|uniref:ATP-binding protein n=1 Tax=Pseudarthrobacter raffinosi TaxID=2953651 RepID=UPI00208E7797|nr:ATP-binding protein [Pseudarthrobacter sp. MDT3-9]MCO4253596.1 ATP-binding protein [Pseudarthrobacter sp. MDT3-9]